MGPGKEDLGALGRAAHLHHIDPQAHALGKGLALDLLADRQVGLGALVARADAQAGRAGAGINAGDEPGEDLMLLGVELVIDHAALRFPHALDDDLAGGLGGDAAKIAGLDLDAQHIAQLRPGQRGPGLLQAHLGAGVIHLLHHILFDEHAHGAQLFVGVHGHVIPHALVVPLVGRDQRLGDLLDHIGLGDALLLFDHTDRGEKFRRVQLVALLCFCVLSRRHCSLLL